MAAIESKIESQSAVAYYLCPGCYPYFTLWETTVFALEEHDHGYGDCVTVLACATYAFAGASFRGIRRTVF